MQNANQKSIWNSKSTSHIGRKQYFCPSLKSYHEQQKIDCLDTKEFLQKISYMKDMCILHT